MTVCVTHEGLELTPTDVNCDFSHSDGQCPPGTTLFIASLFKLFETKPVIMLAMIMMLTFKNTNSVGAGRWLGGFLRRLIRTCHSDVR